MPTDITPDRRRYTRIEFDACAQISQGGQQWSGQLLDISLKGVMLASETLLPLKSGAEVELSIKLLGNEITIDTPATLTHLEDQCYGFTLHDIGLDALTRLRRLLELNLGDETLLERELDQLFLP